ncbi:MAG: hypothetical protein L6308_03335 [Candidatus Omnitrophica bacterium]|nr:hypothetical protein [Candidatus Omnitrophota bacterium]
MLRLLKNRKAQNTMEYALLIAVVIGVFSAMQLYLRRGMQARLKSGSDNITEAVLSGSNVTVFGNETQYEPYYMVQGSSNFTTTSSEGTDQGISTEAGGNRTLVNATVTRTGEQTITGTGSEE